MTLEAELVQLDVDDFSAAFQREVAQAVQMELTRVTVVGITEGSVVVEFRLQMTLDEATRTPDWQGAIGAIQSVGGYPVLSAEVAEVVAGDDAPADSPEGAGLLPVVAGGVAAAVVALLALYKACCRKKVAPSAEYAQWN